ncbi:Stress response protein nst1 [Ophidiomyces ophidiicola]|nr:Stress response protein nst1 [Ophidiomyces ophidiicola]KAI1977730.1 Stress response protein nst1 [Ophidiomyces ophidiicola]KAI1992940.1 Stress response protein nst1 [Ophidiomyces ophidiicola]
MPSHSKRSMAPPAGAAKQVTAASITKKSLSPSLPFTSAAPAKPNATATPDPRTDSPNSQEPSGTPTTGVNRKKQKRRQKLAARQAAERQLNHSAGSTSQNGDISHNGGDPGGAATQGQHMSFELGDSDYTEDEAQYPIHAHTATQYDKNGMVLQSQDSTKRKGKKKKNRKSRSHSHQAEGSATSMSTPSASLPRPVGLQPLSSSAYRSAHKVTKDRIWNTSTHEERERIKEFWLQLGEEERRSLVKVEKEAVLRKMKEQQKHSCSCTVCGRKRTAIEEELEVLYDAYYEELEQYANHKQGAFENGGLPLGGPPRLYQTPIRTLDRHPSHPSAHHPSRGRVQELQDDDEEPDEDYDEDEEDDEPYSEDELEEVANSSRADFFAFGNSLTVKDGILTVADDLLKNDGKHFIDMMEQLAERRMQREEDTQYAAASAAHQSIHGGHNHGPLLDDEDYDDEEEEDYDSQEEEEYEEDEMDAMTEEQRMEEGRRMFQIFAARMFEQRVLTAYREKIAHERQQRLIEELEEENRLDEEREAKKAREAQKRKDKKRIQKQAKEEEKAKREAERAAEEAAQKALEEKKLEEQRRKKEEQRKKREAEKKAQEEERLRKETERQKRLKEERERQAEAERKQREQKEREKKKRDEAKRKEREEKEAKEKEAREKKAKEERERKAREEKTRREKEAAAKADREAKERARLEEQAAQQVAAQAAAVQAAKRASQSGPAHLPPGLHHTQGPANTQSPHFQVATPVVPKAPTPMRQRQSSQQDSHASSPRSQVANTDILHVSPGPTGTHSTSTSLMMGKGTSQPPSLHHPQPAAPLSPIGANRSPRKMSFINPMQGLYEMPPGLEGLPLLGPRISMGSDVSGYPNQNRPVGDQFRGFVAPESIPLPPGIAAPRPFGQGRGFPIDGVHGSLPFHPSGGTGSAPAQQSPAVQTPATSFAHVRQPSLSFDKSPLENQPISRPAPIQRPASTVPHDQHKNSESKTNHQEIDELSAQLGSSALLDDSDIPLTSTPPQNLSRVIPPGLPLSSRRPLGSSSLLGDPIGSSKPHFPLGAPGSAAGWAPHNVFGPPGFTSAPSWGPSAGPCWSTSPFGSLSRSHRVHTSRPVAIRLSIIQACKQLNAASGTDASAYHNVRELLRLVELSNSPRDAPVVLEEMLEICDTEGDSHNGGGSFVIKDEGSAGTFVKFEPDNNSITSSSRGSMVPGDIGSPVPANSVLAAPGSGSRHFAPSNTSPTSGF